MIKKLAIAVTHNDEIGYNGSLLFKARQDLRNFAQFTRNSVMIAGRNTAQEMLDLGLELSPSRPMVVLSSDPKIVMATRRKEQSANLYYAQDLASAATVAASVATDRGLSGWTVVGGKSLYEAVIPNAKFDMAYVAEARFDTSDLDAEKLVKLELKQPLITSIKNNMLSAYETVSTADLVLDSPAGRRAAIKFTYLYDQTRYAPQDVSVSHNGVLRVNGNTGLLCIPLERITAYVRGRERECLTIYSGTTEFPVRLPSGAAGINYLSHVLDTHLTI